MVEEACLFRDDLFAYSISLHVMYLSIQSPCLIKLESLY